MADLHDVDNAYRWAGTCSVATTKLCQPNLAAETVCKAQTASGQWATGGCEQCGVGEGTCTVPTGITTVWAWISQVNAANYAGHNDWRLPSEDGRNTSPSPRELETILVSPYNCGTHPCIASIFGPTASAYYWSSSTLGLSPSDAWYVFFHDGYAGTNTKANPDSVRAVRSACVAPSGTFCDLGNGTVVDYATGLQWEKKTSTMGSGVNETDLHDVDNPYSWAGCCNGDCSTLANFCQPNAAAAASCAAQASGGTEGCGVCTSGTCDVDPLSQGAITTVWDWVSQMNNANYAGHADWRLPSQDGRNTSPSTNPRELETILLAPYPFCEAQPCIDSAFGPTGSFYWSSSTWTDGGGGQVLTVSFDDGSGGGAVPKLSSKSARAVRGGS